MDSETIFTALPFRASRDGNLYGGEAIICASAEAAATEAVSLGDTFKGAVAFSRVVNVDSGECEPMVIIKRIGELPDLTYLAGVA